MPKTQPGLTRFRNLVIAILVLAYLAVCAFCLIVTRSWIGRPFPGFLVLRNNYVTTLYRPAWQGYRQGLRNIDLVLAVDGRPVNSAEEFNAIILQTPVGTPLTYTVQRGQERLEFTVPVAAFTVQDYLFCMPLGMLAGLYFLVSGLIVLYLKPLSTSSWFFLASFVSVALLFASNGERCTTHLNFIPVMATPLMAPSLLLFSMYFPLEIKRARLLSVLVGGAALVIVSQYLRSYFSGRNFGYVDRVQMAFTLIAFCLGVALQLRSYFTSADPIVRQKAKIVIFGFAASFLGFVVQYTFFVLPKTNNLYHTLIPCAPIPLAFGYAILKHNLFDLDVFIRRTASYVLVSGIVIALFFALIAVLSLGLQYFTGQSSQIAAVISTILMVILFRPLRRRIDQTLDRRFFRERYQYTATIRKASRVLVGIIDLRELLRQILETVLDAIQIERGLILIPEKASADYRAAVSSGYPDPAALPPFPPDHPLLRRLEKSGRALQLHELEESEEFGDDREPMAEALRGLGLVLALPILYEQRLIGLLGLGERKTGAGYSSEDLELLQTLMIQTAVSIENARKVEELKQMVELETSYRELKRLDEMKDHFLSMVSHDLRTPMTSIKGYTAILLEKLERLPAERQKHYLSIIHQESDRLTRLINNLLDLQRFEAGRMMLNLQELDLVQLVQRSLEAFQGAALAKQQTLEQTLPSAPVKVRADADRLAQVVANLLSNATKFTPEGGRILVTMESLSENGRPGVRVAVRDNGPGISLESQAKLFSKFQQAETLVKSKEQGSGLGLALVREIIEHLGGKAGVESAPGQGATFYFILPIST